MPKGIDSRTLSLSQNPGGTSYTSPHSIQELPNQSGTRVTRSSESKFQDKLTPCAPQPATARKPRARNDATYPTFMAALPGRRLCVISILFLATRCYLYYLMKVHAFSTKNSRERFFFLSPRRRSGEEHPEKGLLQPQARKSPPRPGPSPPTDGGQEGVAASPRWVHLRPSVVSTAFLSRFFIAKRFQPPYRTPDIAAANR